MGIADTNFIHFQHLADTMSGLKILNLVLPIRGYDNQYCQIKKYSSTDFPFAVILHTPMQIYCVGTRSYTASENVFRFRWAILCLIASSDTV